MTSFEVKNLNYGIYIVTLSNPHVCADIYWVGILQLWRNRNPYSINKIIATSYMNDAIVSFDGTNISIGGGDGITIQQAVAIKIGYD